MLVLPLTCAATSSSTRSERLGLGADAVFGLDAAVLQGKDRLEVESRANEALRATDASAAVQEFERVDGEVHTDVVAAPFDELCALSDRRRLLAPPWPPPGPESRAPWRSRSRQRS